MKYMLDKFRRGIGRCNWSLGAHLLYWYMAANKNRTDFIS